MCILLHMYIFTCIRVYIQIDMCVCMYTYIYIYLCIRKDADYETSDSTPPASAAVPHGTLEISENLGSGRRCRGERPLQPVDAGLPLA